MSYYYVLRISSLYMHGMYICNDSVCHYLAIRHSNFLVIFSYYLSMYIMYISPSAICYCDDAIFTKSLPYSWCKTYLFNKMWNIDQHGYGLYKDLCNKTYIYTIILTHLHIQHYTFTYIHIYTCTYI